VKKIIISNAESFLNQEALSKSTRKSYNIDIKQFISFFSSKDIDKVETLVVEYFKSLNCKISTKKRKYATLVSYFNYLQEHGYIEFHLIKALNIKFETFEHISFEPLSKDDKDILLNYIDKYITKAKDKLLLLLTLEIGIKSSDLFALKKSNFSSPFLEVNSNRKKLSKKLSLLFKEHLVTVEDSNDLLFINRLGNKIHMQSLRNIIKKINSEIGTKYYYNNLRDTYFEQCFKKRENIYQLSNRVNVSTKTLLEKERLFYIKLKKNQK